jgi:hypothetical protein
MRTTIMGTGPSTRWTVARYATLAILVSASVSACAGSSPPATPATFSPGPTGQATPTLTPSRTASGTPTATTSSTATPTDPATPSRSASPVPTAAPATGGGGTAGFQDALLFGLGAAAILAGAGSIAYRRKLIRNR